MPITKRRLINLAVGISLSVAFMMLLVGLLTPLDQGQKFTICVHKQWESAEGPIFTYLGPRPIDVRYFDICGIIRRSRETIVFTKGYLIGRRQRWLVFEFSPLYLPAPWLVVPSIWVWRKWKQSRFGSG
jgi:hypothetical protein